MITDCLIGDSLMGKNGRMLDIYTCIDSELRKFGQVVWLTNHEDSKSQASSAWLG